MTIPRFRSTAAFTLRSRLSAPMVDRATFVLFSLGGERFAAPVEAVERVLRPGSLPAELMTTVAHAGRQVPLLDIRTALGIATSTDRSAGARMLVFIVQQVWVAAEVDAVYEVATLDASLVRRLPASRDDGRPWPVGSRGLFTRHEQQVIVLDMPSVMLQVIRS